ncbi:MAG: ATP-binding protein [Clostridiales bacterium]|nr:ATP-binding protein [Clostridiales bacterium]
MKNTGMDKLPIGIENFAELRTEGFYYIDKTALIRDLLYAWGKVNLFTRPRRFGKSLNMSMLKTFFEIGCDSSLFEGLEISGETELCERYMGKYPVIFISLKNVDCADYEGARMALSAIIGSEAQRFQFLLESQRLSEPEKAMFQKLIDVSPDHQNFFNMTENILRESLGVLTRLLEKHYSQKVILLIDEYDVPLARASERGYYKPMADLIRGLFNQDLKTNDSLYFAVLTGCLRIAEESIFTGLNNPKNFSITNVRLDEYFGFTDREVREMLQYYNLEEKYELIKEWYDGYRFGNEDVYCPWDVMNYCDELIENPGAKPQDYWSNTSGNQVVRAFIEKIDDGLTRGDMEALIAGETVEKEIHMDLTYDHLYDSAENIWSVLFTTGYLTQRGNPDGDRYLLTIPNREIRRIFTRQIMEMFRENVKKDGARLNDFCNALKNGNAPEVERQFTAYLSDTVSIRDTFVKKPTKENFYHGILMGILGFKGSWKISSNRESGDGYSDILAEIENEEIGMVIEVKHAEKADYDKVILEAFRQIERERYEEALIRDGCSTIYKYAIACYKKRCRVSLKTEKSF